MSTNDKLQTLLLANSVFAMYSMMGFHVTMSCGGEGSVHSYEVSVFWNDDPEHDLVDFKIRGCLRDGDASSWYYHQTAGLPGGWTTFEFFFE